MRRFLPLMSAATLAFAAASALAQSEPGEYRGTEDQQMVCTPDVFRLCAMYIPNVTNIVGCLKQQTQNLSPACRVMFEADRPSSRRSAQPRRDVPMTDGSGAGSPR